MNMKNDSSKEATTSSQAKNSAECGPGCNCGASGLSMKGRVIICLAVALVAAIVLARGFMRKHETDGARGRGGFTTALPSAKAETSSPPNDPSKSSLWGKPLASLASLNQVATGKDAVFIFVPAKGQEQAPAIRKEIEAAASKAQSRGTTLSAYTLDETAPDYASVTRQTPAPCVLTMVKGLGMKAITGEITEAKLLEALVTASRPSGCGGGSCGPSGCP